MKTFKHFSKCSGPIILLVGAFLVAFSAKVHAQTSSIGPNQYAFQLTANPNYGLFFNANNQRYEFLNGDAQGVFGFDANDGRLTTDLELSNNADYLVPNNRYAFRAKSNPNYGLFFNASQLQYEFRNSAAAPVFRLSAATGELSLDGGLKIGNSTSSSAGTMRWNGDLEVYDGSDWTSLTTVGASGASSLQAAYDGGSTINATEGAVEISGTDGFVVSGTSGSGAVAGHGAGSHMFFNPRKAAFRAGTVSGNLWNDGSLGEHSIGMGQNAVASGQNSVALGQGVTAQSAYEVVVGRYNTSYPASSSTTWDSNDRLFTVGNGLSSLSKEDAMVILKNGRVGIGTATPARTLDVAGNIQATSNSYAIRGVKTGTGTFPGVWGETESTSTNATGVRGYVLSSPGVGAAGVHGKILALGSSNGYGVKGTHAGSGIGVYGESGTNGTGVYGTAYGTNGAAVKGVHSIGTKGELGTQNSGVIGTSSSSEQTGRLGTEFAGVHGRAQSPLAIGVYGVHESEGGNAGFFDGKVVITGTLTSPSDLKLKTNIVDLDKPLTRLTKLAPKTYDFKTDEYHFMNLPRGTQFGLISQEVEKVFPELVMESFHRSFDDNSEKSEEEILYYSGLNYMGFVPIMIGAIKELEERTTDMDDDRMAALEELVHSRDEQIAAQKAQIEALLALSRDLLEQNERFDQDLQDCCFHKSGNKALTSTPGEDAPELGLNVPNPFRESTSIQYYLPAHVKQALIRVSTMDGKPVKDIQLGATQGRNQVEFHTNGMAAGTYLYSLFVDDELVATRKMVVSR